jgi:hypothetical protein
LINNLNADAAFGHFFQNRDWQYLWNITARARWDLFRLFFIIPYFQGDITWLAGGGGTPNATDYGAEFGLRCHGVLDLEPYCRFQHRENARYFRGPADYKDLIGLKVLF